MSPALRMKVAAVELAAAIEHAFPNPHRVEWKPCLPELVACRVEKLTPAPTWRMFAARHPDPLHHELLAIVPGLAEIRTALRRCWKLARNPEALRTTGAAGEEYRILLRDLMATRWLRYAESHEWQTFDADGDWLVPCEIGVTPLNSHLAERLANAVQPLVVASQSVTRSRRGSDPKTDAALNLFEQLCGEGRSVADAEQIVGDQLGMHYAHGSLGRMLRLRRGNRRGRKAA